MALQAICRRKMENANSRHTQIPCPFAVRSLLLECLAMTTASTLNCFFSISLTRLRSPLAFHDAQSLSYYSILDATRAIGSRYSRHNNNRHNCHSVLYPPWNTHTHKHIPTRTVWTLFSLRTATYRLCRLVLVDNATDGDGDGDGNDSVVDWTMNAPSVRRDTFIPFSLFERGSFDNRTSCCLVFAVRELKITPKQKQIALELRT